VPNPPKLDPAGMCKAAASPKPIPDFPKSLRLTNPGVGQSSHRNVRVQAIFSDRTCGKFATDVERQIEEKFGKTGTVRFVYRHMAFLGDESQWAAEASECAGEQAKFWEYHDKLFDEAKR